MRQGETEGGREGWRGREIDRVKKREGEGEGERERDGIRGMSDYSGDAHSLAVRMGDGRKGLSILSYWIR